MAKDIAESFVLKLCTYEECFYLASLEIIDQLLPREVATSPIPEVSMVELTTNVELSPGHNLLANNKLSLSQLELLTKLLNQHEKAFIWDYKDMVGLSPKLCTHRIYINDGSLPLCQPQRRINLALCKIVKTGLQKLLYVGFIYPISNRKWVSPLVIIPKKGGKWWI